MKKLALLAPFVLLAACASEQGEKQSVAADEVVVGLGDELANKVTVFADRLEFDPAVGNTFAEVGLLKKIDAKSESVYLVGNRQKDCLEADGSIKAGARNPRGYLRKATGYQRVAGGAFIVTTEPATMADAVEEVKKNGMLDVGAAKIGASSVRPLTETIGPGDTGLGNWDRTWNHTFGSADGFTAVDLSGKSLFSKKLLSGGEASLKLTKGKIQIKPTVDARILIQGFVPQNGKAILTADVDGEIEFEAKADGAFDLSRGDVLFSKSWGGTTAGVPLTLGLDIRYECGIGFSGNALATIGATAKGGIRAGGEYDGTTMRGILDKPTYEFNRLGPKVDADAIVQGACHLVSEISVQLFDAAGPQATVDLYAKINADARGSETSGVAKATLAAGVEASVGGSLRPFGVKIADIKAPPFTFEKELFNGQVSIGK